METFHPSVIIGSETGILKGADLSTGSWMNFNHDILRNASRDNEILCLSWADDTETRAHMALRSGSVQTFDLESGTCTELFDAGGKLIVGLEAYKDSVITCLDSGIINVWNENGATATVDAGAGVCRMRCQPLSPHICATGGKENDLKLWDVNKPEAVLFKAKNVRHDFLNLRVPVWILDIGFVRYGKSIITSTAHYQVRMYDTVGSQRRPILDLTIGEHPLTTASVTPDGQGVIVGSADGKMSYVDLRQRRVSHSYKGFAGSIRSIKCHPTKGIVASCGLDRFLRVHEILSRKLLNKIYLKSRLNDLLLKSNFPDTKPDRKRSVENEDEEDMWKQMDTIQESSSKTKMHDKRKRRA